MQLAAARLSDQICNEEEMEILRISGLSAAASEELLHQNIVTSHSGRNSKTFPEITVNFLRRDLVLISPALQPVCVSRKTVQC